MPKWTVTPIVACVFFGCGTVQPVSVSAELPAFKSNRAFGYLEQVCRIGPRISGSAGMKKQQRLMVRHFSRFDCKVAFQPFDARHPRSGRPVRLNNAVVSWNAELDDRILVACHYDTRPYPDRDPVAARRLGTFIGANDGGSGVALLMEMAHHMEAASTKYGVDFVFFDGEELVYREGSDEYFLGSTHFAEEYVQRKNRRRRYHAGVLLDMVGDRNLVIYQERNSLKFAPSICDEIWSIAKRLGYSREFVAKPRHEVLDDHLPLNEIAGIPTADIIDFDYPHWHTTRDVPRSCSGKSLVKVAAVVWTWMHEVRPPKPLKGRSR